MLDLKEVEQLNKKAMQLNYSRQQQVGALEAAKKNYAAVVNEYKEKYGVELNQNNIQKEYDKVASQIELKAKELKDAIQYIESGEYKNKKVEDESVIQMSSQDNSDVETVQSPKINMDSQDNSGMDTIHHPNINIGKDDNVIGVKEEKPKMDIGSQFGLDFGKVSDTKEDKKSKDKESDEEEESFSPEGWGTADSSKISDSFNEILGGKFGVNLGE